MVPVRALYITYTYGWPALNWGWNVNDTSPPSPAVLTRDEMSRNGVASSVPPCAMRMRPGRSAMNRRESPRGACKSIGRTSPAAALNTCCSRSANAAAFA